MRNPSQALVWSAFSLSWPALLTQIAAVVSIVFLIHLASEDSRPIFEAADLVILIGFAFLYIATLNGMQNTGRVTSTLGFPYRVEFSFPVATSTLTFVPLFYFCVLTQVAVFVPGMIVNALFLDVGVSYLAISFVVFQFTIIPLMLTWWTRSGLACLAGYLIGFYLYAYGYLLPEFVRVENTWIFETDSASNYLIPLLCTAAMLVVTYFGVRQQRSGESLLELPRESVSGGETVVLRNLIPFPIAQCPTTSGWKAELWKERQLNGENRAIFGGLVGAGITLAILSIISFFVPDEINAIQFASVVVLTLGVYVSVCVGLTVYMFGVRYKNGVARVSIHDKTTPLNTAQLTLMRVSVSLLSTLIAGIIMAAVLWVLGPYLISDFQEMRVLFLDSFDAIARAGFAGGLLRIVLILLAFLTGLFLFAIFLTWFMLHSRKIAMGITAICVYVFLLSNGLIAFYKGVEFNPTADAVARGHLWILIVLIPVGMALMFRGLLQEWVINKTQMMWLLAIGTLLQGLNLIWLFGANNYDALNADISIAQLGYLIMQGFLPLLAAVFALWTANKIRHG